MREKTQMTDRSEVILDSAPTREVVTSSIANEQYAGREDSVEKWIELTVEDMLQAGENAVKLEDTDEAV